MTFLIAYSWVFHSSWPINACPSSHDDRTSNYPVPGKGRSSVYSSPLRKRCNLLQTTFNMIYGNNSNKLSIFTRLYRTIVRWIKLSCARWSGWGTLVFTKYWAGSSDNYLTEHRSFLLLLKFSTSEETTKHLSQFTFMWLGSNRFSEQRDVSSLQAELFCWSRGAHIRRWYPFNTQSLSQGGGKVGLRGEFPVDPMCLTYQK